MMDISPSNLNVLRNFRDDEGGFTSLAVMLAVVLAVLLMLTSLQVYWVNSRSADIQTVADLGALAAANVIAKIMTIGMILDAISLTMSIVVFMVFIVGAVVTAITFGAGTGIMKAAYRIKQSRDTFTKNAKKVYDKLDLMAPYLAMANSLYVIRQNSDHGDCWGLAIPATLTSASIAMKETSDEVDVVDSQAKDYLGDQGENNAKLESALAQARAAEDSAARVFSTLGGGLDWSWGTCLTHFRQAYPWGATSADRSTAYAEAYFQARLEVSKVLWDDCGSGDLDRWYGVPTTLEDLDYYRNPLFSYTEGSTTYHGDSDCPSIRPEAGALRTDSLEQCLGTLGLDPCTACEPPDIDAFEKAFAELNRSKLIAFNDIVSYRSAYLAATAQVEQQQQEMQDRAKEWVGSDSFLDKLTELLKGDRFSARPGGRSGFICIVIAPGGEGIPDWMLPEATGSTRGLPPRVALAAAAIAPGAESPMGSLMEAMKAESVAGSNGSEAAKVGDMILGWWGTALEFYAKGVSGLVDMIDDVFESTSKWGLGFLTDGLRDKVKDAIKALGLEPPATKSPVPALVNTSYVLKAVDGPVGSGLNSGVESLQEVWDAGGAANDPGTFIERALTSAVDSAIDGAGQQAWDTLEQTMVIEVEIELMSDPDVSVPLGQIPIPIPAQLKTAYFDGISRLSTAVTDAISSAFPKDFMSGLDYEWQE